MLTRSKNAPRYYKKKKEWIDSAQREYWRVSGPG
jgi:hypothetical protein